MDLSTALIEKYIIRNLNPFPCLVKFYIDRRLEKNMRKETITEIQARKPQIRWTQKRKFPSANTTVYNF